MQKRILNGWYMKRWKILKRDNFTCQYCGQSAPNVQLEVDHKVALADGGTDEDDNLTTSCWACNRGKAGLRQSIILANINKGKTGQEPVLQMAILAAIKRGNTIVKDIALVVEKKRLNVRVALCRLQEKGLVKRRAKGQYIATELLCPQCQGQGSTKTDNRYYKECCLCKGEGQLIKEVIGGRL